MKKISLILLGVFGLLFSTKVYADSEWTWVPFYYMENTYSVYYDDDYQTNTDFFTDTWYAQSVIINGVTYDNVFTKNDNCTTFGHYSDGSNIPCYSSTLGYQAHGGSLYFYRNFSGTTDPNTGKFESYLDLYNTRKVDFFPNVGFSSTTSLFRFDVSFKLDFFEYSNNTYTSINNSDIANNLFNSIWVPTAYDNGVNCYSTYNNNSYQIDISCSGEPVNNLKYSFDFRTIKDNTSLKGGVNGNYRYYIRITASSSSILEISSDRLEDLIMNNSPSGDTFGDYYKKINLKGSSYFDKFNNFEFDGLSNVIIAPLQFFRSLSTSYYDDEYTSSHKYSCNVDPLRLNLNVFDHQICIPSGHIFWNRGRDLWGTLKARKLSQFRNVWNVLLGGFIIYLLCVKLFKVCVNALDPHKEDIETL